MKKSAVLLLLSTTLACSHATTSAPKQRLAPRDGRELLAQMHDAYAGKWYRTLTFVQKTTIHKPGAPEEVQTWYESVLSPDRLRIDFGDLSAGNGVIYTADSVYVVRAGKQVRAVANGNPFLPFVAGAYTQPLEVTLRQIAPYHFDLSTIRQDTWNGRPVYVVGAKGSDDLTSPQFWIDRDNLVAVRMILNLSPAPDAKPMDIRLDNYVPVAGGWLATKVAMLNNGEPVQVEEYSDWKGNPPLKNEFFAADKWTLVPHWAH